MTKEEETAAFLEELAREVYPQGDNYFATKTRTGKWRVGYSNDAPLQHGSGEEMMLPQSLVDIIME